MSISGWAKNTENWLMMHVPGAEWLVLFGAGMAVLLAGLLVLRFLTGLLSWAQVGLDIGRARAARLANTPGFRILVAPPPGGGKQGHWIRSVLQAHLGIFSFGAPFTLILMRPLRGGQDSRAISRARRRMAIADADLFVWTKRGGRSGRDLEVYGLTRAGGLKPADARFFTLTFPWPSASREEAIDLAASYLIAKQLQPTLGDPRSFRAQKIRDLAHELGRIIESGGGLPARMREEIEADFCSAGVRVAEEIGELGLLDRVIRLRRLYLDEASQAADPGRIIMARLDLGRALIIRSEKQFDQSVVKEAISHLAQAVEGLRADPVILRAQAASDALFKAQSMIESRKRFSLNFGS